MNRILSYLISLAAAAALALAMGACEDRLDYPGGPLPEGSTTLDLSVGFKAFTPALEGSRAQGNAIKTINTLWLVIFDKSGSYIGKQEITGFTPESIDENTRPDGSPSSEDMTGHVSGKLTLPNGYYRIYTVVNHDLSTVGDELINTPAKLKSLDLTWVDGGQNVGQNGQMFGWLVNGDKTTDHGTDAPIVTVSPEYTQFHSWVRRAASKVTIAFNTTQLSESVRIYLHSVVIKDIPKHCYLDKENSPGEDGHTISSELVDGETLLLGDAQANEWDGLNGSGGKANHNKWVRVHSGDSIYGFYSDRVEEAPRGLTVKQRLAREHSEAAPALYFYENLQGTGTVGTESDKRQDVYGNNAQVTYPDGNDENDKAWKDAKPFGSYIEVRGYYENNGTYTPGKGNIIYRFMLGKDVITDYNSERNHHYRLTMTFKGNANDIDFHIDYKEEAKPGLSVQDTTYVSYLYNQESSTVVRATPRVGYDVLSLEAYIMDNEWRPYAENEADEAVVNKLYNTRAWNRQATHDATYYPRKAKSYESPIYKPTWKEYDGSSHSEQAALNTEFGFLSLRKMTQQNYELGGGGNDKKLFVDKIRRLYFRGDYNSSATSGEDANKSRGHRNYGTMPQGDGTITVKDPTHGSYTVTRISNPRAGTTDYIMEIPFYTRAKSIDSWAVYSGANPFYKHHRYARVRFIATYKKKDSNVSGPDTYQESEVTHVKQARRIDNPRTIYRQRTNTKPFFVQLCYNTLTADEQTFGIGKTLDEKTEIFAPIISRGPWTATIERDLHGLVSISANGRTARGENGTITGRNNTPIQFTYTPSAVPPEGECYGAIITVRYHNNSCTHKIIVRQGYEAHAIGKGTTLWSAFNIYDKNNLTRSPLSIGSTFRRHTDLSYPIAEANNFRDGYYVDELPTGGYIILGKDDEVAWSDIPAATDPSASTFGDMSLYNVALEKKNDYTIPDWKNLKEIGIHSNKDNPPAADVAYVEDIGNAFGIAYADGAEKTLLTKEAYNFSDPDNVISESHKGVRGVTVYSLSTGDNVFLPFGCFGNPRRRNGGLLQYGSINFKLDRENKSDDYRPMAYDLRVQVGGSYWIKSSDDEHHVAIDFNGGNYMSSYLNVADCFQTDKKADALPIKPVHK